MSFIARFPGKCSACGDWFAAGTAIALDDSKGYRHLACDGILATIPPFTAREVCARCWLEKSVTGECGCS